MSRPQELQYAKTHEWVRVDGDTVTVGITDHAIEELGDLAFVDLPQPGDAVEKGKPFGEIESTKTVADLVSPVDGEVIEAHSGLADDLQLLTSSPFEEGWLVKIRPKGKPDTSDLLDAAAYEKHIQSESH